MPKYVHFSEVQKQAAKSVDLAQFLQERGEPIKKSGSEYEWVGHHITLRGNQFYDQYQQKGGSAVDFVREQYNLSYPEAVEMLLGGNTAATVSEYPPRSQQPFHLPPANENMRRVYAYLIKQRCIGRDVIYHFAHRNLIYEDAQYHNAVFVGTDADGKPRHAHKKSTSLNDSRYRGNQTSSDSAFSFHHIGKSNTAYVFEAPIDMLSFITLYPDRWKDDSYITLCSVADRALFYQLEQNPHLRSIRLCLDNDNAGRQAMVRISNKLAAAGYDDVRMILPQHKDFNEDLQYATGKLQKTNIEESEAEEPCLALHY